MTKEALLNVEAAVGELNDLRKSVSHEGGWPKADEQPDRVAELLRIIKFEGSKIQVSDTAHYDLIMRNINEQLEHFSPDRKPDNFNMWSQAEQEQWYKKRGLDMAGHPTNFGVHKKKGGFWNRIFK